MLQLHEANRLAQNSPLVALMIASTPANGTALEEHANLVIGALRGERVAIAKTRGFISWLGSRIDEALRTDSLEHMDEADYPQKGKFAIAQGLHLLNWSTGSYRRFVEQLEPIIREVNAREQRPARILELACGAGGFSMGLSSIAAKKGLRVGVTGSDIVPLYVERANAKAAKDGNTARFRQIDALNMDDISPGSYDIVFVAQSVHHFSPGQLARMISETSRVCTTAFVSVDGYRSVPMIGFVVGTALLTLWPSMVHDAVISVRKFYGENELQLIGEMGAPKAKVAIGRIFPLHTTLTVRFDGTRG